MIGIAHETIGAVKILGRKSPDGSRSNNTSPNRDIMALNVLSSESVGHQSSCAFGSLNRSKTGAREI
jgi:hypothetical protein